MARKQRKQKRQARREALQGAAAAATTRATPPGDQAAPPTPPGPDATQPVATVPREPSVEAPPAAAVEPAPRPGAAERRRRPGAIWPLIGVAAAAVFGLAVLAALALDGDPEPASASASPSIVVGVPGGEVTSQETPTPTPEPTESPTPQPTESPTPEPTASPTPEPTPAATPQPQPAAPPATPAPPPSAPEPTPVIVAVAQPEDAVAAFYSNVAAGNFDAAYALWSDRMKATYPRQENLDERFEDTASITFHTLRVVQQADGTAVVQANFTETYDSGGSREFIGYWELIRVDGRWLLDAPYY